MNAAIVTGATGFIGRAVIQKLIDNDIKVLAICRNFHSPHIIENELVQYVKCDVNEINSLIEKVSINYYDTFYNFAWAGVDTTLRCDFDTQLKNVKLSLNCLRVAKQIGCKRFIGVGSIMEREIIDATLMNGVKPSKSYTYGASKFYAHMISLIEAAQINIDFIWTEITNAYGVGENSTRLINTTLKKIIKNEKLEFTDGKQNYDFIYIDDAAKAFYLIGKYGKPFKRYVIGSYNPRPLREYLLDIKEHIAPDKKFEFGKIKYTGLSLPLSSFYSEDLKKDTGFKPEVDFNIGVERTYNWLKNNYDRG